MTSSGTIDDGVRVATQGSVRNRVLGLLALVVGLGVLVVLLESGLSGEPVPSYVSSSEFDEAAYQQRFDQNQIICSETGHTVLSGDVECVPFDDHGGLAFPVAMTVLAVVGAALVVRWGNPIGWLLMFGPVVDLTGAVATAYAIRGAVIEPGSLPASRLAALVGSVAWILLLVVIVPRFLMTIPDGRLASRGWRWAVRFTYVVAGVLGLIAIFHPMLVGSIPNPLALPWSVETADSIVGFAILGMVASWAIAGMAVVVRVISALRRRLSL
ncbi:MAG: hypothetical protein R3246_00645 [Acidimicrobiia bacterium]|nr:hypothetical protein [Acidimicrobiia bacterium]